MNVTYLEGYNSISSCLKAASREIYKIYIDEKLTSKKPKALLPLKKKAEKMKIPVEYISSSKLEEMATGKTHGGVIAECGERSFINLEKLVQDNPEGFFVYLDGIEDPFNFGQAVRAIYASGADGVLLPERNWMSSSATVGRASAGASELIDASVIGVEDIAFLKEKGFRIVCADLDENSVNYSDANLKKPLVLVIGGEKRGISAAVSEFSDLTVEINYGRDFSQSLGASEAVGILAFEVLRQNR